MSFTEKETEITGLENCFDIEMCIYASNEIYLSNSMYYRVYIIVVFGLSI